MKQTDYKELTAEIKALVEGVAYPLSNYANVAAAIWQAMEDINWAGFYLLEGETLYLGPFQGKPACVSISVGNGVCGTAVATRQTLVVEDVHEFPGHIACDDASRSEIVIPMINDDRVIGVLDIDSPVTGRFDHTDKSNLEEIVSILIRSIK
jgi:GAF domain-containing protein